MQIGVEDPTRTGAGRTLADGTGMAATLRADITGESGGDALGIVEGATCCTHIGTVAADGLVACGGVVTEALRAEEHLRALRVSDPARPGDCADRGGVTERRIR